jgi:flagellar hook-associated protein 3 FlgL
MIQRISTSGAYDTAIENLLVRQNNLSQSQMQLTSGKRVNVASDDPTAAAQAERARALEARTTANERAVDASTNAMTLTESALGDASDLLQQARDLVVQAGNASYGPPERASIAQQIKAIRDQLLTVANRSDGQGGYVFSGQGSNSAPFAQQPGASPLSSTVTYTGTGGSVDAAADEPLPLTLDGGSVWLGANSGNGVFETKNVNSTGAWIDSGTVIAPNQITGATYDVQFSVSGGNTTYSILKNGVPTAVSNAPYSSGQQIAIDGMSFAVSGTPAAGDDFQITPSQKNLSVFDALDKVVDKLTTTLPNGAANPGAALSDADITQAVQDGLRDIDQVSTQIGSARGFAGSTLTRLDGVKGRLDATQVSAQTAQSSAEDLDMVKALSSFQNQQTGYSAALQSYASIQKMSLFNYLNT